jgi:hypothetical protein
MSLPDGCVIVTLASGGSSTTTWVPWPWFTEPAFTQNDAIRLPGGAVMVTDFTLPVTSTLTPAGSEHTRSPSVANATVAATSSSAMTVASVVTPLREAVMMMLFMVDPSL